MIPQNCRNCGAPLNPHDEKCTYCGTYWQREKSGFLNYWLKNRSFRKNRIYPFFIGLGVTLLFTIYLFFFDSFSETQLVALTPVWYFSIVVGLYGYAAEKLTDKIVNGIASDFRDAYRKWQKEIAGKSIFLSLLASVFYFPFPLFKRITPLRTALVGALIWGLLLAVFFEGIFPAL